MKNGKTLVEMAKELERQIESKKDYIVSTKALNFITATDEQIGSMLEMPVNGHSENFKVNDYAHRQIADRIGIPAKYYEIMRQKAPALLDQNVNHWFQNEPERRMVRILDDGLGRSFPTVTGGLITWRLLRLFYLSFRVYRKLRLQVVS